jgi:hypothetical protein
MRLYTCFLDYGGGTYIAQVQASSPKTSLKRWLDELPEFLSLVLGPEECEKLGEAFKRDTSISRVEGVQSVWCATTTVGNQLAVVHLITTEPNAV